MPRPVVPNDYLDTVNLTGSFSELQKVSLRKTFRRTTGKVLQANQTATTIAYADVAGISFNVQKGQKYRVEGTLLTLGDTTGGIKAQLNVTGQTSPTVVLTGTATLAASSVAQRALSGGVIFSAAGVIFKVEVNGFYIPDGDGVATLQFAQSAANGISTLYAGSHLKLIRVG